MPQIDPTTIDPELDPKLFKETLDSIIVLLNVSAEPRKMINLLKYFLNQLEIFIPDMQLIKLTKDELSWEITDASD